MRTIIGLLYKNYNRIKRDLYLFTTKDKTMSILWHSPSLSIFKLDTLHTNFFDELLNSNDPEDIEKIVIKNAIVINKVKSELEVLLDDRKNICLNNGYLRRLNLLICQRCTLRCIYCYAKDGTYGDSSSMSIKTAERIISVFTKFSPAIYSIQFFGGEPLLNLSCIKYVIQRINYLALTGKIKMNPNFVIVTSLAVSNGIIQELIKLLASEKKLNIIVSCDGPASINDIQRPFKNGEPSFQIISRNIDILKPYGQPISVEVTYTKKHLTLGISPSDLQDYFEKRFGITNVIVVPVISKNDSLSLSQTIATSLQFERIRDVNRISENIYIDERIKFIRRLQIFTHQILSTSPSKLFCDFGVSNFTITTKGDIYPCQLLVGLNKFKIENVFSDFDKIHYALRKSIRKYRKISEKAQYKKCADCYLQFYCTGCPAGEYILNRKFISPSMFDACDMRKEVIKETLIAYAINVLSDKTI